MLLHAATAIFLFLVLWRMTGDLWPSAFVAAVFAIHPLRVESVAWVAERKDVLSGLFFMLTLWAYLGYVRRPFSLVRYLAVMALFALGLMAKPMLVTLPFVLLLLDYWPLGRLDTKPRPSVAPVDSDWTIRLVQRRDRRSRLYGECLVPCSRKNPLVCVGGRFLRGDDSGPEPSRCGVERRYRYRHGFPTPWFPTWPIWASSSIRRDWRCSIRTRVLACRSGNPSPPSWR